MASIEHYKSASRNLLAANERLKRQLDKALDVLATHEGSLLCPDDFDLGEAKGSCSADCRDCWKKALEEVE